MRYKRIMLLVLSLNLFFGGISIANQRWTRKDSFYTVQKIKVEEPQDGASLNSYFLFEQSTLEQKQTGIMPVSQSEQLSITTKVVYRGETIDEIVNKIAHEKMTDSEKWYLKEEIKFLNKDKIVNNYFKPEEKLKIPIYKPFNGGTCCSDMRNMMVAVMKGEKYGVHWAYLIGVRSQENPSPQRDHYAYGVVCKKGTNLWTQAEWAAKILKRCTRNANKPSFNDIDRASHIYVGYETDEWPRNVWAVYNRCQG